MSETKYEDADVVKEAPKNSEAREKLTWATLFLGELRDGLTMVRIVT